MSARTYSKGSNTKFTAYQTVEVDAEMDFTIKDIYDAIADDNEAVDAFVELLKEDGHLTRSGITFTDSTGDFYQALQHLDERSFEMSVEDQEAIIEIAKKYRFIPVNRW
jgi:hypothetical protein